MSEVVKKNTTVFLATTTYNAIKYDKIKRKSMIRNAVRLLKIFTSYSHYYHFDVLCLSYRKSLSCLRYMREGLGGCRGRNTTHQDNNNDSKM